MLIGKKRNLAASSELDKERQKRKELERKLTALQKDIKINEKIVIKDISKSEFPLKPILINFTHVSVKRDDIAVIIGNANYKKQGKDIPNVIPAYADAEGIKQYFMKAKGIKELSIKFINKSFNPKLIKKMNDEEAIQYLSTLRQIGRWSAEMILLFTFNRSNIWPVQDIGLLRAISNNYKKKYLPPQKFVIYLKNKFSPYCSVATWYLWRSIDDEPIQY